MSTEAAATSHAAAEEFCNLCGGTILSLSQTLSMSARSPESPDQSPELSIVLDGFGAQAEGWTQTLGVNEAAYKNHTTPNSSRETDALKAALKSRLL